MVEDIWIFNIHVSEFEKSKKHEWYNNLLSKVKVGPPRKTSKRSQEQLIKEGYVGIYSSEALSLSEFELLGGSLGNTKKKRKGKKENIIDLVDFEEDRDAFFLSLSENEDLNEFSLSLDVEDMD